MNQMTPLSTSSVSMTVPREFSPSQLALIRKTVAKDCDTLEFDLFIQIAKLHGLCPFRKQIYAIVTNKDKPTKRQLVPVTGIDGFRAKAARCADYRPSDEEPEFVYKDELKNPKSNPLGLEKAIVKGYKQDNTGKWNKVVGFAYWDELAPLKDSGGKWVDTGEVWEDSGKPKKRFEGNGDLVLDESKQQWIKSPRNQLAKCAEAQMLRKGWPDNFSGLYATEEMDRAVTREMSAAELADQHEQQMRLTAINHKQAVPFIWSPGEALEYVPIGQVHDRVEAYLRALTDANAGDLLKLAKWRADNREGLNHFWAVAKSDALHVKTMIEDAEQRLSFGGAKAAE